MPKFCRVCKLANNPNDLVCNFCGAVFVDLHRNDETTRNMTNRRTTDLLENYDELNLSTQGMAFFLFGKTQPFAVQQEDILYLGRPEKESTEVFINLGLVDGFNQGVSRRHAMIQREGNRVEIMDLSSINGTFLDGNRLLPNKFYELKSGTVIQLGRLKLIAIFSWSVKR